jgi:hypothetical protein
VNHQYSQPDGKIFFPENPERNFRKSFCPLQMNVRCHISNNVNNNFSPFCASVRSDRFVSMHAYADGVGVCVWALHEKMNTVTIWNKNTRK